MNRDAFISQMMPHALRVSQATGIDPRLVIAQSALETGWGRSAPGNNFFGIKSHGKSGGGTYNTWEVVNGQKVNVADSFRGYGSMGESADDYARFLRENPRYKPLLEAQGLDAQIEALSASGYATDPQYGSKVRSIASSINGGGGSNEAPIAQPTTRVGNAGNDTLSTQGTAGMPVGLLEVPEVQQSKPLAGGLLGDWLTEDKRDRLVMALEGMTMNPNKGLMVSAAEGIRGRAEQRKETQAEAKTAKQANRTIEYLQQSGAPSALIALARQDPKGALNEWAKQSMAPAEQRKGMNIDGKLVDPVTGELIADYSTQEPPEAPRTVKTTREDGSEVVVQWDSGQQKWVPLNAPGGATSLNAPADLTESEQRMTLFKSMQDETAPVLNSLEERYNPANIQDAAARNTPLAGNFFKTPEGQQYQAAAGAWAEGALRLATGAAATPEEFDRTMNTYFAKPGDRPETIAFKAKMREMYTRSVRRALGERNVPGSLPDPMKFAEEVQRGGQGTDVTDEDLLRLYGD